MKELRQAHRMALLQGNTAEAKRIREEIRKEARKLTYKGASLLDIL